MASGPVHGHDGDVEEPPLQTQPDWPAWLPPQAGQRARNGWHGRPDADWHGHGPHGRWDKDGRRPTGPLRRAYHGRMLAGVAAGIADYLGVDVTIIRVAFAVATLLGGAGVPAYLACLLLIPEEGSDVSLATDFIDSIQSR